MGKIWVLNYFNLKHSKHLESEAEARYIQIRNKALICNFEYLNTGASYKEFNGSCCPETTVTCLSVMYTLP